MDINLISVTSPKGGGKDEVVKIIQWLTFSYANPESKIGYEEWKTHPIDFEETSKWQNKKFGYKLKQVASILLGVPVEKFEDREFKESYLDDYQMTVRQFLQICGTNAMRDVISNDIWVNGLFVDFIPECNSCGKITYEKCQGCEPNDNPSYWVLSDGRFPSELQRVKDYGGITVKIDSDERLEIQNIAKAERLAMIRLTNEDDDCFYEDSEGQFHLLNDKYQEKYTKYYNEEFNKLEDTHESETAWRDWEFDYVIDNNKDIPHLIKEVEKFYKHYKL